VFGDPAAAAILDPLLRHRQVVTVRGDSRRLSEKRRAGFDPDRIGKANEAGLPT